MVEDAGGARDGSGVGAVGGLPTGNPTPEESAARAAMGLRPLTLSDLTADLIWPNLLRAAPMCLRMERLLLAFLAVVLLGLLGSLESLWTGGPGLAAAIYDLVATTIRGFGSAVFEGRWGEAAGALRAGVIDGPAELVRTRAMSLVVLGIPMLLVWTVATGAIARASARQFAHGVFVEWPRAMAFGLWRWFGLFATHLVPLVFAGVIVAGLVLAGGALFSVPGLDLVGALVFPLMLVGGAAIAVVVGVLVLGAPMLTPAIACEGTDAIDAMQRVYHYVLHRPLRLVVYLLVWLLLGVVVIGVALLLADAALGLTRSLGGALVGERGRAVLNGTPTEGVSGVAAWVVSVWSAVPMLIVASIGVSYYASGGTVLYLLMRRLADGQDESEIWVPGLIEGTLAATYAEQGRR